MSADTESLSNNFYKNTKPKMTSDFAINNNSILVPNQMETTKSESDINTKEIEEPTAQLINDYACEDNIASFYDGAHVFVTGGTGFVGKVLLEKLLRCCPGIETIYVLTRPKRGLTIEQRYKELIKSPVFDRVKSLCPARIGKLVAVGGDVSQVSLGLSDSDIAKISRTTIVFHSAATVRFTEPLQAALALNVLGTKRLMELCKTMPDLKMVTYISTAYSNAPRSDIAERVYPSPYDPDILMHCASALPKDTLDLIAERLQGDHPNTYTLTKAIAEGVVQQYSKELPLCIVRPSIVTAASQDPVPGWIDNVYGVTGIMMEISRGTYRSGYSRGSLIMDIVPVDIVVNTCVTAAWHAGTHKKDRCPVFNCISGQLNSITWNRSTQLAVKWARENPSKYVMWWPNFALTESRLVNVFWESAAHLLPAFIYDIVLRATGRKPIMLKLARRFKMAAVTGEYFANNEWRFETDAMQKLVAATRAASDGVNFHNDITTLEWELYMGTYIMGIRKYILKDTLDSLPAARSKLRKLYWAYRLVQALSGYLVYRMLFSRRR